MAFGYGDDVGQMGDAEGWQGAPMDGVDVISHMNIERPGHAALSSDAYLAIMLIVFLGAMWLLGGIVFKGANS